MPFLFQIVFFAFNPENAIQLSLSFSSRLVYDCISEKVPTHGRLGGGGAGGSLSNIRLATERSICINTINSSICLSLY